MGVDYSASIMVGVSMADVVTEDFEADDHDLEVSGDSYSGEDMVVGVNLVYSWQYGGTEFTADQVEGSIIKAAKDKVRSATGAEPKLMLTLSVS